MTTINGFIRAANASYKRAVREKQKHAREAAKRQQQNLKFQLQQNSVNAVRAYDEYIASLLSVQKICSEPIDWESLAQEPEPKLPVRESVKQFEAEYNYNTYEPSVLDYILIQNKKKLKDLQDKIELAKQADDRIYNGVLKEFRNDIQDWRKIQSVIKGIQEGDPIAYKNAIDFFDPFAEISQLGSQVRCEIFSDHIIVNVHVNSSEVVPNFMLTLTPTGKLSNRKMGMSKFHELYQDYICGCVLRIARESFALLPVKYVFVNAIADVLNGSTGYKENKAIVSVRFDQEGLARLNFDGVDCSEAVEGFEHRMKFSKIEGFSVVEVLTNQGDLSSVG
jgi:hypothetical protein